MTIWILLFGCRCKSPCFLRVSVGDFRYSIAQRDFSNCQDSRCCFYTALLPPPLHSRARKAASLRGPRIFRRAADTKRLTTTSTIVSSFLFYFLRAVLVARASCSRFFHCISHRFGNRVQREAIPSTSRSGTGFLCTSFFPRSSLFHSLSCISVEFPRCSVKASVKKIPTDCPCRVGNFLCRMKVHVMSATRVKSSN